MSVERAAAERFGPFPAEWGLPRGAAASDERAAWVREHVERETELSPVRARVRNLRRIAELNRRRWPPV